MNLSSESMNKKILITTGDKDGIGLEVALKAFSKMGPQVGIQFIFYRSSLVKTKLKKSLQNSFNHISVSSLKEALEITDKNLIEIVSSQSPATWVEEAAKACLSKKSHALVTGPLSKETIKDAGLKDIGHTGIFKRLTKTKDLYMGFFGDKFNVAIVTDHIPLKSVSKNLTASKIFTVVKLMNDALNSTESKKIGILGLNPHSGENGIIGHEEIELFKDLNRLSKKANIKFDGPLVPDAAFFKKNWSLYSAYIALYHDQGLIPFKMIHGQDSGVHVTLGLPFIRTSVDHGTAKDIFGKNKANPNSMIEAIHLAIKLARHKNR